MNIRSVLVMLTLLATVNLAKAQDDYSNGGGGYPRRSRSNPQQQPQTLGANPTGYVSVNSGIVDVMGNFGLGIGTGYGNYALGGSMENISAGIPINHTNFGVALMIAGYDNPFDINNYLNNVAYQDPNPNRTYSADTWGSYSETNFMGGFFYTYPVKRFSFDLRAMIGYLSCSLPEIGYSAIEYTSNPIPNLDTWDISSSSSKAVSYDIGAGVRYASRRNICIMLNVDMLQASIPYNTVEQHVDPVGNITNTSLTGTIPLSLLNISLGLGYQFGK